jgi:hypothetical protein
VSLSRYNCVLVLTNISKEFGIDIVGEDNRTVIYHKVAARVVCVFSEQVAARSETPEQEERLQTVCVPHHEEEEQYMQQAHAAAAAVVVGNQGSELVGVRGLSS